MCFAEQVFLLDLARAQSLPSAAPTREEPRDAVCSGHDMCITFSLSRQAVKSVPARANRRRTRTRNAHYSIRIDQFHSGFPTSYIVDSLFGLTVDC